MKKSKERKTMPFYKVIINTIILIISFVVQILFYSFLLWGYKWGNVEAYWYSILKTIAVIVSIFVISYIYSCKINSSLKITWIILVLLFPLFGTTIYLLYGHGRSMPKRKSKKIREYIHSRINENNVEFLKDEDLMAYNLIKGLCNSTYYSAYINSEVKFYDDAKNKAEDALIDLQNAKEYIFLEFFIVSSGKLLDRLIEILKNRAEAGVEIYMIYDDVGSKPTLNKKDIKKLLNIKTMHLQVYAPFGKNLSPSLNYRDHRKIIVIDGKIAYNGGDNLADEYVHDLTRFGYWRDNALKIEGDAVNGFVTLFLEMWYMSSKERLSFTKFKNKDNCIKNKNVVMPFGDGPTYEQDPAYSLFMNLISLATKTIYISTPYFIIDQEFINTILRALRKGVEVIILTPGIPDKKSVFYLTRAHYKDLLQEGAKIYEYSPGFNHAKNVIIDNEYAYIGTTNIDYRSFFLHFECGTLLYKNSEIIKMKNDFLMAIKTSHLVTYDEYKLRGLTQRFIAFLLSFFSPLF